MSEQAVEILNNFFLLRQAGILTWHALQDMPQLDYEGYDLCRRAANVAQEIQSATKLKPGQIASAYNRQHYADRLGLD